MRPLVAHTPMAVVAELETLKVPQREAGCGREHVLNSVPESGRTV